MAPTELYLIRHGIAADRGTYDRDEDRPLIDTGIRKTQQVAQRLQSLGLSFERVLTSPLVRAQQTAELLRQAGLSNRLEVFAPLAPGGGLPDALTWLAAWQQSHQGRLALVGHEPDLSQWAAQLVTGAPTDRWILKKAGIIGLKLPAASSALGGSELFLLVSPRFFL
jgi:phosphohistidine phosphatase